MSITIKLECRKCGSTNIKKNGFNVCGNQQYYCKDCKASKVLEPKWNYTEGRKEEITRVYFERASLRGIERAFGTSPSTVLRWLKKKAEKIHLKQTLTLPDKNDVLEVDEMWSFVGNKNNPQWLWLAISRATRHVVAFHIGGRGYLDCLRFYQKIPKEYKIIKSYSDNWEPYKNVFPYDKLQHECVDKSSGETNHIERFNLTLRQRLGRYVRKTLSFSKKEYWHILITKLLIIEYNKSLAFS